MAAPTFTTGFGPDGSVEVSFDPNWEQALNNAMRHQLRVIADEMEADAQRFVPIDTGDLKRSIKARLVQGANNTFIPTVTATEPYAAYVEYGTGQRGQATVNQDARIGRLQQNPTYDRNWPGNRAQPFLRPALWNALVKHFKLGSGSG